MLPQDILHFWFEAHGPTDWYAKSELFDAEIREKFAETYAQVIAGETTAWRATMQGRLAEIIVLDQFARNMFRGTAAAFVHDDLALDLAKQAIAAGELNQLTPPEKHFLLMPYMHSESQQVHLEALRLFTEHGNADALRYEQLHKNIIDRFGRYPHRNTLLGRTSTQEEIEFLKTNPGF